MTARSSRAARRDRSAEEARRAGAHRGRAGVAGLRARDDDQGHDAGRPVRPRGARPAQAGELHRSARSTRASPRSASPTLRGAGTLVDGAHRGRSPARSGPAGAPRPLRVPAGRRRVRPVTVSVFVTSGQPVVTFRGQASCGTSGLDGDRAGRPLRPGRGLAIVPKVLQTVTAPKYRLRVDEAEPPPTAYTALATDLLTLALLAFCLLVVLDGLRRNPRRGLLGVSLLLAPWVWVQVRGFTLGSVPGVSDLVYPAVVVAVWVPAALACGTCGCWATWPVRSRSSRSLVGLPAPRQGVVPGPRRQRHHPGEGGPAGGDPVRDLHRRQHPRPVPAAGAAPGRPRPAAGAPDGPWSPSRPAGAPSGARPGRRSARRCSRWRWWQRCCRCCPPTVARCPAGSSSGPTLGLVAVLPVRHDRARRLHEPRRDLGGQPDPWRDHPWVGNGSDFYTADRPDLRRPGGTVYHGHNEVVHCWSPAGVVLALLTALLVAAAVHRATRTPEGVLVGVAVAARARRSVPAGGVAAVRGGWRLRPGPAPAPGHPARR